MTKYIAPFVIFILALTAVCVGAAWADEAALLARIEALEKKANRVETLEQEVISLKRQLRVTPAEEATPIAQPYGANYFAEKAGQFEDSKLAPTFGGMYTKPFLKRFGENIYLGGYADIEFIDDEDSNARFDQHRLIPFIYADVSDRVKFATEIEFEHGGTNNNQGNGEVKVEFATIDYLIHEGFNLRGGILLSPLGKFNAVHDSPLRDLTNRPLVAQHIIPTTLSEAGAGVFGTFYPTEMSKLDYEFYVVNGFDGLTSAGVSRINTSTGVRSARGSERSDNNDSPAFVSRIGFSPFLGLDTGFSVHTGAYDDDGSNYLTIYAWDLTYQHGPFEVLGELAYADIERNFFAKNSGVPDDLWGYYVQGNYHFMPEFIKNWAPTFFKDESTFTLSTRWDQEDLDGQQFDRLTVGLNFRPTEDTVFKLSHVWNLEERRVNNVPNNELVASIATYF